MLLAAGFADARGGCGSWLPGMAATPRVASLTVAHQGQRSHKHDHSLEGVRVDHCSQATWGEHAGDGRHSARQESAGSHRRPTRSAPARGDSSALAARGDDAASPSHVSPLLLPRWGDVYLSASEGQITCSNQRPAPRPGSGAPQPVPAPMLP